MSQEWKAEQRNTGIPSVCGFVKRVIYTLPLQQTEKGKQTTPVSTI
jgi:hypothetical protein